jgi:hypothetical protein
VSSTGKREGLLPGIANGGAGSGSIEGYLIGADLHHSEPPLKARCCGCSGRRRRTGNLDKRNRRWNRIGNSDR